MSQQSAHYQRSSGGMVGAMIVMVVLILAWVGFWSLTTDHPTSPVHTVDYLVQVPVVRKAAAFDLVAPPSLPRGWEATSVRYTPAPGSHWHLGLLTEDKRYVGLEQGDERVADMVEKYVDPSATVDRQVDVAGRPWASYTDSRGDLALVRREGSTTTLVVGHDVARSTLVSYTESLR